MSRQAVGRTWHPGMMSSLSHEWATPHSLFEMLNREFHFTLDACATADNSKCEKFLYENALHQIWVPLDDGAVWCNPPYGRKLGDWVEKAYRESIGARRSITIVMLVPARTDTQWFHQYCLPHGEIRFIRGRISFENQKQRGRAPLPSMVVVFRGAEPPCST